MSSSLHLAAAIGQLQQWTSRWASSDLGNLRLDAARAERAEHALDQSILCLLQSKRVFIKTWPRFERALWHQLTSSPITASGSSAKVLCQSSPYQDRMFSHARAHGHTAFCSNSSQLVSHRHNIDACAGAEAAGASLIFMFRPGNDISVPQSPGRTSSAQPKHCTRCNNQESWIGHYTLRCSRPS